MSRIIAVPTAAGSAGKTTTVVSLAAILGAQGRSVLVVDGDPQGTATEWLGVDPEQVELDTGAVMLGRATLAEAMLDTNVPGVQLMPAAPSLDGDVLEVSKLLGAEQRLRRALADAQADVVFIDCPGSISPFTIYALVAAESVLTVTQPAPKELRGLPKLEALVEEVRSYYNPTLTLVGVVPCITPPPNSGRLYTDAMTQLRDLYGDLVTPSIRRAARPPEALSNSVPLPIWAPNEPVTADYHAVATWLNDRRITA